MELRWSADGVHGVLELGSTRLPRRTRLYNENTADFGPLRNATLQSSGVRSRLVLALRRGADGKVQLNGRRLQLSINGRPGAADGSADDADAAMRIGGLLLDDSVETPRAGSGSPELAGQTPPSPPASAAPRQTGNKQRRAPGVFIAEATINSVKLQELIEVEVLADGRLAMPISAWKLTRLRIPQAAVALSDKSFGHCLEEVPGLTYELNRELQTLTITAPAEAFLSTRVNASPEQPRPMRSERSGVYLNYDLSLLSRTVRDQQPGVSAEAVGFGPWGLVVNSFVSRYADHTSGRTVRLETFWRDDQPESMRSLQVGDNVSASSSWGRPVRFGGLRWTRDFSLQPGYVPYPLPGFAGSAALPSTLDVLVNNQKRFSQALPPGPFEIGRLPLITGLGDVSIVVRDALGRETVVSQRSYLSPRLLATGTEDYSFELGALRRNFGQAVSSYGPLFGAASYRRGLNDSLSLEGRIEVQADRKAVGLEADGTVGELGVVRIAVAASAEAAGFGQRALLAWDRSTRGLSVGLRVEAASGRWTSLGVDDSEPRMRRLQQGYVTLPLAERVSASVMLLQQHNWNAERSALLGASLAAALPWQWNVGLYANRSREELGSGRAEYVNTIGLTLTKMWDGQHAMTGNIQRRSDGVSNLSWGATRMLPPGPGYGWSARVENATTNKQAAATASWNTSQAQFSADLSLVDKERYGRWGANGSVGLFSGYAFASRRIDQSGFLIADLGGVSDVSLRLNNQTVARTDGSGKAVITQLLPYQQNWVSVDSTTLPLDVELATTSITVVPYARSGLIGDFNARRLRSALLRLSTPDGQVVPAGARLRLQGSALTYLVYERGQVYIDNLDEQIQTGRVEWQGNVCLVKLDSVRPAVSTPQDLACAAANADQTGKQPDLKVSAP